MERVDVRNNLDFTGLPDELDASILSRDTSISMSVECVTDVLFSSSFIYRNRDKNLIKHECLRFEELPRPGTLVAIDAEFVLMQEVR
jgi:hypothetical protein